ncbi:DUF1257 domain-containing protein [Streptomyces sp. B22F1]|uniref:DUF1257 domain-containing protein n=1 Tax=Streptomyces sp. B22F1 TaxID=3153566 RepID=UPI00325CF40B
MSHFTRIRTKLRDADVLVEALRTVGYDHVEVHDEPATLYGYQGDARPERAEVVIRRAHIGPASNDIGFARQPDGSFEAIISEYDRHRHDPAWLTRLSQSYGHAATLRYAAEHGYEVATDELQQDGTRRLTLRRTN